MRSVPLPPLAGWRDFEHWARYQAAAAEYRSARGLEPDRHWRALLRLATALPGLWHRVRGRLRYARGEADLPPELGGLSHGEACLYRLARHLYTGRGEIDLADLVDTLDRDLWGVVTAALLDFRGRR